MRDIIVLSTQRSGSTFFCESLENTDILGIPKECFLFLERKKPINSDARKIQKKYPLLDILKEEREKHTTKNGIASHKIMWTSMSKILAKNGENESNGYKTLEDINSVYNNPLFIFYRRRDDFAQCLSHSKLRKTKLAHIRNKNQELEYKKN
ncbi:Stf0 family sulfotransferase [Vreelandella arctica]|uniref:Stf0 family sulfotransferase n=1 Tax=Vreelandella arctica TaxID=3126499 RepID=UPI00300DDB9F